MLCSRYVPRFCRGLQNVSRRNFWDSRGRIVPVFKHDLRDVRRPFWSDLFANFEPHFREMDKMMNSMEKFFDNMGSMTTAMRHQSAEVKISDQELKIKMNVQQYKPEELNVKIMDNKLTISGKQENKDDTRYYSREFTEEFLIPEGIDSDSIISTLLEDDGVLLIKGMPKEEKQSQARNIDIDRTQKSKADGE